MSLAKPRFIALDTGLIAELARHNHHGSDDEKRQARDFLAFLAKGDFYPLMTGHHIIEISQHADDDVVDDRMAFIGELPFVAWLSTFDGADRLGTIVDVRCAEVEHRLKGAPPTDLADSVRGRLLRFGEGARFRDVCDAYQLQEFRQHARQRQDRNREIASLTHMDFSGLESAKWADILKGSLRSATEAGAAIRAFLQHLTQHLRERGDKRLKAPEQTAACFTEGLLADAPDPARKDAEHPAARILRDAGVDPTGIAGSTRLEDIGYLAVFCEQIRQFGRIIGEDPETLVNRIDQEDCPSWILWREMTRESKDAARASGADLHDRLMACLCLYVDVTVVDKRTYEYVARAFKRRPDLQRISNPVVKTSSYENMAAEISDVLARGGQSGRLQA